MSCSTFSSGSEQGSSTGSFFTSIMRLWSAGTSDRQSQLKNMVVVDFIINTQTTANLHYTLSSNKLFCDHVILYIIITFYTHTHTHCNSFHGIVAFSVGVPGRLGLPEKSISPFLYEMRYLCHLSLSSSE